MHPVIDFHTHILPGIDDGSPSVETSIALLKMEAEQGIEHVVATPHFYANHESPKRFLAKRREAEARLREAMARVDGLPKLSVGAEVYFFEGISDAEDLPEMAIEGTDCVLVEMPMKKWSDRNLQELLGIRQKRKLTPIVAHVDRYIDPLHPRHIPVRLAQLPVLIQANASFFTRRLTRRLAVHLLEEGKIHLLGSDCHNLDSRKPNVEGALEVIERYSGRRAIMRINELEHDLFTD